MELQTDRAVDLRDDNRRLRAYADVVDDAPPTATAPRYDLGRSVLLAGLATVEPLDRFARQRSYERAVDDAADATRGAWAACPDFG